MDKFKKFFLTKKTYKSISIYYDFEKKNLYLSGILGNVLLTSNIFLKKNNNKIFYFFNGFPYIYYKKNLFENIFCNKKYFIPVYLKNSISNCYFYGYKPLIFLKKENIKFKKPFNLQNVTKNNFFSEYVTFFFQKKAYYYLFLNYFFSVIKGLSFGWYFDLEFVNMNYKIYVDTINSRLILYVGQSHGNILKCNKNIIVLLKKKKKIFKIYIL